MNKFLYIYTFYSTDPCRLRNFKASIEQLKTVDPEADICVVEQNGLTSIPAVTFHHKVDFDDTNFHKTGLLNYAVKNHPDYTHYVMIDADSWIDAGVVDNIHNHCDDAPLVFPYETCVYLSAGNAVTMQLTSLCVTTPIFLSPVRLDSSTVSARKLTNRSVVSTRSLLAGVQKTMLLCSKSAGLLASVNCVAREGLSSTCGTRRSMTVPTLMGCGTRRTGRTAL